MRSSNFKQSPLRQWLRRSFIVAGLSALAVAACSAGDTKQSNPTNTCTADLGSDPQNCGKCGNACVVGEACVGGTCTLSCVTPQIDCGGVCANPANNALHCGGCNQPCASGQICENSACVTGSCPTGQSLCNGACVDTQTDLSNCGNCGAACLVGQSCESGTCVGGGTGGTGGTGGSSGSGTGGTATGGSATGGTSTGGTATGGTSTGGSATGGSGTGGTTNSVCRIWLATNGNDSNPGTETSPVATLQHAYDLMCPTPPSGTANGAECLGPAPRSICVKSGTYTMTQRLEFKKTRMGTASNRLILQGDPNSTTRPVFDFRTQTRLTCGANPDNIGGFTMNADYVTVKNLVVRGANDTCILVQGSQGLVEHVLVYECADTGIQINSSSGYTGSGTNNTIKNCDSHSNWDVQCNGENADGFAIKEGTGTGNVFTGCRSWDNTDDGFDLFAWTDPVRIENCWAFDQSRTTDDAGSDGNGFKLGGNDVSTKHVIVGLYAVGNSRNTGNGFTNNSNPASMTCTGGCAAWGNVVNVNGPSGVSTTPVGNANVTNMAADSARNADGSLKAISAL